MFEGGVVVEVGSRKMSWSVDGLEKERRKTRLYLSHLASSVFPRPKGVPVHQSVIHLQWRMTWNTEWLSA